MEPKKIFYNTLSTEGKKVEVTLTEAEQHLANSLQAEYSGKHGQRVKNSLGYEINITTLTTIMKKITEQKFFHVAPSDYLPVRVGEGAWSSNLVTYREFQTGDDFTTGIINTGANNNRMAQIDVGVDSLSIPVLNWVKSLGWSIFDLELAAKSGNWDIVSAKEKSRKKNWDLGIQKIAFLGDAPTGTQGLYTQTGVKIDTTTLTQAISSMDAATLSAFLAAVLNVYRTNCQRTAMPTHFVIPESDYLGLATASSASFPLISKLEYMQQTFRTMTGNSGFKILPCAYGDKAYSGASVQKYLMYNSEESSIRMDIPVDYTNTLANSLDNFNFQNAAYGQFTGVKSYRPAEFLEFQF